jgi:uncharacterized membrane protein YccC
VPGPVSRPHPLRLLRAELTLRSGAFRHAGRLSIALIVAGIAYRSLSPGSGYWVPLTVLFVLKPDYGTTIARGIGRAAGTMAGVSMAWVIVTLFSPPAGVIVALLAVLAGVAYTVFAANYALFSVVLTVLIALLAEFSGGSPVGALVDRIVDTALGTAIPLGAITLWPPPQAPRALDHLAVYVTAEGGWLDAILTAYADGDIGQALRSTRLDARRARAQAQDAVRRAMSEPRRRRPDGRLLRAVLAAMDEISEYALGLAAAVHDGARAHHDVAHRYRHEVRNSFRTISSCLQGGAPPTPPPGDQAPPADGNDQALAAIATETASLLASLEQLTQA